MFDQMPNLLKYQPVFAATTMTSSNFESSKHSAVDPHLVVAPTKPEVPKSFFDALKSPLCRHWIAAAYNQYTKNRNVGVFSIPFHKSSLLAGQKILRTLIVCEVKKTEVPSVWELKCRECIIGTLQKKGNDFNESYSPVIEPTTYRLQIALSSSLCYHLAVVDIKNAFQTSIYKSDDRHIVTIPPCYLEWLFNTEGVDMRSEKTSDLVWQTFSSCQETKPASHIFNRIVRKILQYSGLF